MKSKEGVIGKKEEGKGRDYGQIMCIDAVAIFDNALTWEINLGFNVLYIHMLGTHMQSDIGKKPV